MFRLIWTRRTHSLHTVQPAAHAAVKYRSLVTLSGGVMTFPKEHVRLHQSEKTGGYFYRRNGKLSTREQGILESLKF
jgi:hypothetical protein